MKQIFTFLSVVLLTVSVFAQSPEKMSYQAIIRNSSNALITNTTVGMQISILQGSINKRTVYVEKQTPSTNSNGLVSIEIGTGTVISGDFTIIDWANGPYFIKINIDPTQAGGTNYTITSVSQLISVPYALHAKTAESVTGGISETDPVFTAWDKDYDDLINKPTTDGSETKVTAGTNVTVTGSGTTTNPYVIGTTSGGGFSHYIGKQYGGGVIFHLFKDSAGVEHGLIVTLTDQSNNLYWSNITSTTVSPYLQNSWDGLSNSNAIVGQEGHTSSAAKLCLDLVSSGQSDWYLPSIQELNMLYSNYYTVARALSQIPGATQISSHYWSSSEYSLADAWCFRFDGGPAYVSSKGNSYYVRAVRSF